MVLLAAFTTVGKVYDSHVSSAQKEFEEQTRKSIEVLTEAILLQRSQSYGPVFVKLDNLSPEALQKVLTNH